MPKAKTLMRHWIAEGRDDGCYVIETQPGTRGCVTFGPMVESMVLAAISARRTMVEAMMMARGQDIAAHVC